MVSQDTQQRELACESGALGPAPWLPWPVNLISSKESLCAAISQLVKDSPLSALFSDLMTVEFRF